jgi:hypothetical protein
VGDLVEAGRAKMHTSKTCSEGYLVQCFKLGSCDADIVILYVRESNRTQENFSLELCASADVADFARGAMKIGSDEKPALSSLLHL